MQYSCDIAEIIRSGTPYDSAADKPKHKQITSEEEKNEEKRTLLQAVALAEYESDYQDWKAKKVHIEIGMKQVYSLIINEWCTELMLKKLEAFPAYIDGSLNNKPNELLNAIESLTHVTVRNEYPMITLHDTLHKFLFCKQEDNESLSDYARRHKERRNTTNNTYW